MNVDDYVVTVPRPSKPFKPSMGQFRVAGVSEAQAARAYADAWDKWVKDTAVYLENRAIFLDAHVKLDARFKQDVLRENGLAGHPKAEKVWDLAWEEGCSAGYEEVAARVERLAELVKE